MIGNYSPRESTEDASLPVRERGLKLIRRKVYDKAGLGCKDCTADRINAR